MTDDPRFQEFGPHGVSLRDELGGIFTDERLQKWAGDSPERCGFLAVAPAPAALAPRPRSAQRLHDRDPAGLARGPQARHPARSLGRSPRRRLRRRRRPGYFRVTRPGQLWHVDMTSVWVAEHGWCYLNAAIDCCTREIPAWGLDLRCRAQEALAVVKRGIAAHAIEPGQLVLGTDNGTAYTSRPFRARLAELGITHRRGGYRDPESQAFIESWFSKLKEREIWRSEYETLEDARRAVAAYVERYHNRPHQLLGYRTPKEVRKTWEDAQEAEALRNQAA